jgi:hypothetical protein
VLLPPAVGALLTVTCGTSDATVVDAANAGEVVVNIFMLYEFYEFCDI